MFQQAKVLRIALQDNVPFPIAAMELAKLSKVPSGPRANEAREVNLALPPKLLATGPQKQPKLGNPTHY